MTAKKTETNGAAKVAEDVAKAGAETARKTIETASGWANDRLGAAIKGFDEVAEFTRANVEAVTAASTVANKGFEEITTEVQKQTRKSVEDSVQAARAVFGAKTLQEAFDAQTNYAKAAYEAYVGHSTRLAELVTKTSKAAFDPINERVATVVERGVKSIAL